MALGNGYFDDEGVWHFGEDDENPLASDLFNRLSESTSDQLELVRDELQQLRDMTTPQDFTPVPVAPTLIGAGMKVTKTGRIVNVQLHLTRPAGSPFAASQGLCWLPEPVDNMQARPIVSWFGTGASGHLILAGTGALQTDTVLGSTGATVLYGNFTYASAS